MSFSIFNESFYLSNNPDVQAAVNAGTFPSGLAHFQQIGLAEGRVQISPFYTETAYLESNPDVATAVSTGTFASGLQHFIQVGEAEGRFSISPQWNEATYLSLNPDIASAVSSGMFASGLQHFLGVGQTENRPGTPKLNSETPEGFSEGAYLAAYADVKAAVESGAVSSGLAHYQSVGQLEPNRVGIFFGSSRNDTINAFGESTRITGVGFTNLTPLAENGAVDGIPTSLGVGEMDTLVGGGGTDIFNLGIGISPLNPTAKRFYVGQGDMDRAQIQNFQVERDLILLAGEPRQYLFDTENGNFEISTAGGDTIAIVEGVTNLQIKNIGNNSTFVLSGGEGALVTEIAGFNDRIYLVVNEDVAGGVQTGNFASGFAHYQAFGQNEPRVGVFSGTRGNDEITGFGQNTTLVGVGLTAVADSPNRDVIPTSAGVGEVDILIGGSGVDTFVLGTGISFANSAIQPFYLGNGSQDYAILRNFEPGKDSLQLAGNPSEYTFLAENGNLNIFRNPGDLVGIVEGVSNLNVTQVSSSGRFLMS